MEPKLTIMLHSTALHSTSYRLYMVTPQSRQSSQRQAWRQALQHLHPRLSHSIHTTQRTRDAPYFRDTQKLFFTLQKARSCQDLALVTLRKTLRCGMSSMSFMAASKARNCSLRRPLACKMSDRARVRVCDLSRKCTVIQRSSLIATLHAHPWPTLHVTARSRTQW